MMCNCNSHKGPHKCMQIGGVVLLLVGLVYVAHSLGWLSATLPNFWAVLLVLFGLFTVMEAKAAGA